MSGYKGLDGNVIMAGSPDLDMIFSDHDIPSLLNGNGSIIVGLKGLREMAEKSNQNSLKHRCDLVEKLIIAAQRLITWPTGKETNLIAAEKAIEILNVR